MMRRAFLLLLIALPLRAQTLTLGEVAPALAKQMARAFRPGTDEALYCVTKYTVSQRNDYDMIDVLEVEPAKARVSQHQVDIDVVADCRNPDGSPQPTWHTHPAGDCQASPGDVVVYMHREAPFDVIQCTPDVKGWYFAWQLRAAFLVAKSDEIKR